jgi:hypothetical protein
MSTSHTTDEEQDSYGLQEALELLERLFGPSPSLRSESGDWEGPHRSDSVSSTDLYWQGQYLSVSEHNAYSWRSFLCRLVP